MSKSSHNKKKQPQDDVLKEVAEFGRQVQKAIEAVATSEETRGIFSEVSASLQRVGGKVNDAFAAAKESPEGQKIGKQLKKVVEVGKKSGLETGEKMRVNLATGLREIGSELAKLAEKLKNR